MKLVSKLLASFLVIILLFTLMPTVYAVDSMDNFTKTNTYLHGQFTDVKSSDWFSKNVAKAYELGLMLGNGKTFNPNGNITIAESIALACRLFSIYHADGEMFVEALPWFQVYVDYALKNNIIEYGYTDYTKSANRVEFVQILARALPSKELDSKNIVEDGAIPDIPIDAIYTSDVYMLYRAGILSGNDSLGTFEPNSNIQRSSAAAIVTRLADKALRESIVLYGPINVTFIKWGENPPYSNEFDVESIIARKIQDNCIFTVNFTSNLSKLGYLCFNPNKGDIVRFENTVSLDKNNFTIEVPLDKLSEINASEITLLELVFYSNYTYGRTIEEYEINVNQLSKFYE